MELLALVIVPRLHSATRRHVSHAVSEPWPVQLEQETRLMRVKVKYFRDLIVKRINKLRHLIYGVGAAGANGLRVLSHAELGLLGENELAELDNVHLRQSELER